MQTKLLLFALISCNLFTTTLLANETDTLPKTPKTEVTEAEFKAAYFASLDSVESSINYQTGKVTLPGNFEQKNIPKGFKYLNVEDTKTILFDVWGNVPYGDDVKPLGMLVPQDFAANKEISYAVEITFVEDGFVKDDDAKNINYDDLLKDMQESTKENSEKMR